MGESNFQFANENYLNGLYGLIIILLLFIYTIIVRKKRMDRLADTRFQSILIPDYSPIRTVIKFILLSLAYASVIIALAQPQFGTKLQEVKKKGVEVVIALDVSNSMLAEDIKPSRLTKAKLSIQKLIERLNNDKVGIVVFAGEAYTQLPLTTDIAASKMFLNSIETNFVAKQGTAIGAAIAKAMRSFTDNPGVGKTIIVISDGENHEDDALEQAKIAKEKGITVHTIGMGSLNGSPIPRKDRFGRKFFMEDKSGKPVTTKLNEKMLQEISEAGGGVYARADFTPVMDALAGMDKTEFKEEKYTEFDEKFQYFLALALLFLLLEYVLLERKNKFLKKVSLFNTDYKNK